MCPNGSCGGPLSLAVVPVIYVLIECLRERQPGARKGTADELEDAKNPRHEHDSPHSRVRGWGRSTTMTRHTTAPKRLATGSRV